MILKTLNLFIVLYSVNGFASESKVKKIDFNKDGKIDRIEVYNDTKLIEISEDLNGDGKIDEKIVFSTKDSSRVNFISTARNGIYNKKIIYKDSSSLKDMISKETFIDKDYDGKFEINFKEHIKKDQKDLHASCQIANEPTFMNYFMNTSLVIGAKASGGLMKTESGYLVDNECIKKWGSDFLQDLNDMKSKSLSCLEKLHKNSKRKENTGASKNLYLLKELYADKKVSLVCSESDYDWSGTAGHASTDSSNDAIKIEGSKKSIKHPFISLNPSYPTDKPITQEVRDELKRTIFHEGLHNLGHKHGDGYEYAYTCETCCFPKETNDLDFNEISCKVCLGDYESSTSRDYTSDMIDWSDKNYRSFIGQAIARTYNKENPGSADALLLLAKSESGVFNPVGGELAGILLEKELISEPDDIALANDVKSYNTYDNDKQKSASKSVALAMYYTYYEKDTAKVVEVLEKNKADLKYVFSAKEEKDDDYISSDIYDAIDSIIFENWINSYPGASKEQKTSLYNLTVFIEDKK